MTPNLNARSDDQTRHAAQKVDEGPAFRKEYEALEEEFALMAEVAKARAGRV
jgi:hypothetical protein